MMGRKTFCWMMLAAAAWLGGGTGCATANNEEPGGPVCPASAPNPCLDSSGSLKGCCPPGNSCNGLGECVPETGGQGGQAGGSGGGTACDSTAPVECYDATGQVVGCCPADTSCTSTGMGCMSNGGTGGGTSGAGGSGMMCPPSAPVECTDGPGNVVGCCPTGTTCSSDGQSCDMGTGGSGNAGGMGGSGNSSGQGGSGNTGNTGGQGGSGNTGNTGGQGGSGNTGNTGGQGGSGNTGNTGGQGGSGNTGNTGGQGGSGATGGGGAGGACDGSFESNDELTTATVRPSINDADSNGSSINSALETSTDHDWFTYRGLDEAGLQQVDPGVTVNNGLSLCIYANCVAGSYQGSCDKGTVSTSGGLSGCCAANGDVRITGTTFGGLCASSTDDSADIYMHVYGANSCQPYTLTYHF